MEATDDLKGFSLKEPAPAATGKTDYTKSDAELMDIDAGAPPLGDKGNLPDSQQAAEPKPAELKGKWAEIDEEGNLKAPGDKPAAPKEEAKPDGEAKPTDDKTKEDKPEEATPLADVAMSPALKELLADQTVDAKLKSEIKNSFFGYQAYKEVIPTVQAARDLVALFPTVEDAQKAAESTEEFGEFIEAFNGNPEQFVTRLAEEGKEEFNRVARAISRLHDRIDPEAYGEIGRQNFREYLGYWHEVAKEKEDKNLTNAVDYLAFQVWGKKYADLSTAPDARDEEIARLRSERHRERSQNTTEALQAFNTEVDELAGAEVHTAVTGTIERILGVKDIAITKAQQAEIVSQTFNKVKEALRGNSQLGKALREIRSDGRGDAAHVKRCVGEITKRAALEIRKTAAEVVTHWTTNLITAADTAKARQRQQEARADVSGGSPSGGSGGAGRVTPEMIDYGRTSDEDIMSDKFVVRR